MYLLIGIRRTILNRCRNKNAHSYNDLNDLVEKKSVDKVVKAVISLYEHNYLSELKMDQNGLPSYFDISCKGLFYREDLLAKFIEFIFKSVATPIVVAFITSLIATQFFVK